MIKIGTSKGSCGMGDVLLLTSICKHIPNQVYVELFPRAEKYKLFFDNICLGVEIKDNAVVTEDVGSGHFAQRKMRGLGLNNKCYLPYIYPKKEYINTGLALSSQYKNPVAFVANCAAYPEYRQPDINILQNCVNHLIEKGHTVLQFGMSCNFTKLNNTIPIVDISVYELLCYYSAIKHIVGVDTGDIHAMIALGGSADILIPPSSPYRNHDQWNYKHYNHIKYYIFNV